MSTLWSAVSSGSKPRTKPKAGFLPGFSRLPDKRVGRRRGQLPHPTRTPDRQGKRRSASSGTKQHRSPAEEATDPFGHGGVRAEEIHHPGTGEGPHDEKVTRRNASCGGHRYPTGVLFQLL